MALSEDDKKLIKGTTQKVGIINGRSGTFYNVSGNIGALYFDGPELAMIEQVFTKNEQHFGK